MEKTITLPQNVKETIKIEAPSKPPRNPVASLKHALKRCTKLIPEYEKLDENEMYYLKMAIRNGSDALTQNNLEGIDKALERLSKIY